MSVRSRAKLAVAAEFPQGFFLENLVVRADDSLLVTCVKPKEIWFVPSLAGSRSQVEPRRMVTFGDHVLGIVEVEPEIFLVCTSDVYDSRDSHLWSMDLRTWTPGDSFAPRLVSRLPQSAPNGITLIAPRVLLIADSFGSRILRTDLAPDLRSAETSVWLEHESMAYHPGEMKPEQPGINGLRFAGRTGVVYYTSTTLKRFVRVRVASETLAPEGEPETITGGHMYDDFAIDEDAAVAYLTTHRENTIDRVALDPAGNAERTIVAGDPFDEMLIGPSSVGWSRRADGYGRVAYVTTDGGTTAPPPTGIRSAKVLRATFPARRS